ncbi:TOG array regulator of axonemal microtubules protein 1 isoform X3 [Columba livia]|uniref:TOG array regulator of axonemal microtubules protein 1 isoform X3 n=1 Tax=Columba livia TaxID=8932 RepID=UPI0031BB21A7
MEHPAGPERRLPPCPGPCPGPGSVPQRPGRPAGQEGDAAAAEPPWGPRPALCGAAPRGRRRLPRRPVRPPAAPLRALTPPPARRGPGELCSLAWQRQDEEAGAEPFSRPPGEDAPLPGQPGGTGLKFGLLPPELHARLLDQEDYRSRTQAVEELKRAVGAASQAAVSAAPAPGVLGLIGLLCALLDDSNFKVVLGALEVIHLLALRLGDRTQAFLTPLVSAAAKVLGDNKLAVRREYNRLLLRLMRTAGPQPVLRLLLQHEYLQHRNSRVREEVVNICIVALLTYPGEELDLAKLAFGLAPALLDGKRRVRHAAMEAFAVLASSMGPGKTGLLFKAVDAVELEENGDGVMHAVQARLARRTLPKLVDQGFVEYAVPLPSSGHNRGSCLPPGADTDWLLMGSRTQSAHSYCGCRAQDDAVPNSSSHGACADGGISPRRVLSAGKGKNKLPWENEQAGDGEGGAGVKVPLTRSVEQLSACGGFPHPAELRPSQGAALGDQLFGSRRRAARNFLPSCVGLNREHPSDCAVISVFVSEGAPGSPQPQVSGKCGALGCTQTRGRSGSVDSLQFLGLNNCQQDKVCASLNFSSKSQRSVCNQAEPTGSLQGPSATQGASTLPSCARRSPRHSPRRLSPPARSPHGPRENGLSFSSSWPLKSFEGLPRPSAPRHLLAQQPADSTGQDPRDARSALQPRPSLLGHRGLSGARPVPPIPRLASTLPDRMRLVVATRRSEQCEDVWLSGVDGKLAAHLSELNVDDEEVDQEEMQNSLRSVRNSAARKRAKLGSSVSDLESPGSAGRPGVSAGSPSRSQGSLARPEPAGPRGRVASDTFPLLGSKPQPAGASSARTRDPHVAECGSSTAFDDKGTSRVGIVGERLNGGSGCGDDEAREQGDVSRAPLKGQNTEHQRSVKHSRGLAEPMSGLNDPDLVPPGVLAEDAVAVVGKGVFGSPPGARAPAQPPVCAASGGDPTEPAGSGSQQFHPENQRQVRVALSRSAQEKVRRKRREEEEQGHEEQQQEKEENPWERLTLSEPEKTATANLNLCGDLLTSSRNVSLSLESVALDPSLRRTSSLKKTRCAAPPDPDEAPRGARGRHKERSPPLAPSPEMLAPWELQPLARPEAALAQALALLAGEDWEKKIEGLTVVRCLSAYHAPALAARLHETSLAVAEEVKNLRSGVSRAAVVCLGDLFTHLKTSMDQELDNAVKVLLHKAGESNTFLREEVDKALKAMVTNVTPARALCSLINGGQSHLHSAVRRCAAQHLADVLESVGPERVLAGSRAGADRVLPAIARFAQDSSQQTRYYGRKMLFIMMSHPDFDKTLEKYVPPKDLPYIKESVSNLREKGLQQRGTAAAVLLNGSASAQGLGEMPLDTPSAKGRRSQTSGVGHSRSSSTSRDALNTTDRETMEAREVTRRTVPRNSLENDEYVKDIIGLLNAKDFRDRISGIKQLLADTENNQGFVVANIVKIFDAFKSRLHDSNSKVNQAALEAMHKMIPLLKDNLSPTINMLIPALVDNNLNSKNAGIYDAATNVIQALCQHLDNYLLLQPFCTKAQFLNGKAKQDMTEKLADLVTELYPRKPYAVEQKVLVVLWHLLGNTTSSGSLPGAGGNIRAATAKLARALFAQMGPGLLTHAAAQPPHIRKSLEELLEVAT